MTRSEPSCVASAAGRVLCSRQIALGGAVPGERSSVVTSESRHHDRHWRAAAEPATTTRPLDDQLTTRLLHQRIIVLGTEIDDAVANRICAQLLLLSAEDPRNDISLYINSPGGSVSAGLAVYDTMRLIPNDVSTLAMGLAGSMGQFLLCAGTAGKRYSLPHAQVLMHQGSAGFGGTAADVEIYAEQLERTSRLMTKLTAEHTGQAVETIENDSLRDRWFTAEQALAYGMIDQIVEHVDDVRPTVAGRKTGL
jgi:ATP-dependent Clp protease protease subunit